MKGFTNTIEALVGALLILGVMFYLFTVQPIQDQDMYRMTYNCLKYAKDYTNVEVRLQSCLPSTYQFEYKTCDIVDCSPDNIPTGVTVTSAEYISAGPKLQKVWVYK